MVFFISLVFNDKPNFLWGLLLKNGWLRPACKVRILISSYLVQHVVLNMDSLQTEIEVGFDKTHISVRWFYDYSRGDHTPRFRGNGSTLIGM